MEPAADDMRQIDIIKIYNKKKCLVIDDFPEIRGSLTRILKTFGAQTVDTGADGDEAVRLCNRKTYDIVICDYNLGVGKDGQQVLEEVRYLRILLMTSLFVMLTGESSREMVLGALECQPDDYITKPYTEASLRTRLNRAVVRHEALLPIKRCISDSHYQKALDICDEMISKGSRYASDCIKMKGQLLFLLAKYPETVALYKSILSKKPIVWARLGLAKTLIEMGKLDEAEDTLEAIIKEDNRYIEAHDLLSDICTARRDNLSAQKAIEKASQVSPKSVHRHRKLAELADLSGDDELSMKSHLHAIKWGSNSCYESSQDYFNYVRKVADVVRNKEKSSQGNAMVKQAKTYLERARKKYPGVPEVEAQTRMVEAQLFQSQGKMKEAHEACEKAQGHYNELKSPSINTSLEFARTLKTMEEEDQARAILTSLAAVHPDDLKLMRVIDGITSEPISDDGKDSASGLTKNGIDAYENKDYDAAIEVFHKAINAYPKHVGLNLNLIQAIISAAEDTTPKPQHEKMCRRSLRAIGGIRPDNKQFQRYAFLQKELSKHYPTLLASV